MLKVSYIPVHTRGKGKARVYGNPIPNFSDIRRVPTRYHYVLPLSIMKRHQCVVLGEAAKMLTVGITECEDEALLDLLHVLTGLTIFPVLIEPARMRLLIARVERHLYFHKRYSQAYYTQLLPAHVRFLLAFQENHL